MKVKQRVVICVDGTALIQNDSFNLDVLTVENVQKAHTYDSG